MAELKIERGDILLVDLSKHGMGIRPVVIISSDFYNKYSITLFGVPISSDLSKYKLPTHILLPNRLFKLGFVQAEKILTFDRSMVLNKMENISEDKNFVELLNKSLFISFSLMTGIGPIEQGSREKYNEQLKEEIKQLKKPLVITEGKTDVTILQTAWEKLYPGKEMYFECDSCGVDIDKSKRNGGAVTLRQTLQNSLNNEKPTIGLFDNDRSGNSEFGGLKKELFKKSDTKYNLRKHIKRNIWAMLLPVPDERKLFVTLDDTDERYFVIEHYFPNEVLIEYGMYGSNILGTEVFKIIGNKVKFAQEIQKLEAEKFKNFSILFQEIDKIFSSI